MRLFLSIITGFFFQILVFRYINISGVTVNIMLILTVQIALISGRNRGMIFGFFSGILEDLLFPGLLGERVLARVLIAYLIGSFRGKLSPGNFFFQFIINAAAYLFHFGVIFLIRSVFSIPAPSAVRLIPSALAAGLFAPVFYFIMSRTDAG